jgi:signal transduction histidine kinase
MSAGSLRARQHALTLGTSFPVEAAPANGAVESTPARPRVARPRVSRPPAPDALDPIRRCVADAIAGRDVRHGFIELGAQSAGIAHDFRNLLLAIQCQAALAEQALPPDHPVRQHMAQITSAARQGGDCADLLMHISTGGSADLRPVRLAAFLRHTAEVVRCWLGDRVSVVCDVDEAEDAWVVAHPTQLSRVFMNLADNARRVLPDGGTFGISVLQRPRQTPRRLGLPRQQAPSGVAQIVVWDTGRGMALETAQSLVASTGGRAMRAQRGRRRGLGLRIVRDIVESHGGRLSLESTPGAGTRFLITLPLSGAPELAASKAVPLTTAHETGVMVISPHERIRRLACLAVRSSGYHVTELSEVGAAGDAARQIVPAVRAIVWDVERISPRWQQELSCLRGIPSLRGVVLLAEPPWMDDRLLGPTDSLLIKPFPLSRIAESVTRAVATGCSEAA